MKYYLSLSVLVISVLTNCIQWKSINEDISENKINITLEDSNRPSLGAFSVSLSVKDLAASKAFYENLGFKPLVGSPEMNYYIMKNESTLIGIFHNMFQGNILTFNPGWDSSGQDTAEFDDVREIKKLLEVRSVAISDGPEMAAEGPASFMVTDPDGNVILIDQHR